MSSRAGFGLRPRALGELLDLTFRVYRARFVPLAAIGIVTTLATTSVSLLYQGWLAGEIRSVGDDPNALMMQMASGVLLLLPVIIAIQAIGSLPVLALTADAILPSDRPTLALVGQALRRVLPAAMVSLLVFALCMVGFVLCIAPGIVLSLGLVLALPLVYAERLGPLAAIARSWTLVFQRGGRPLSAEANWIRVLAIGVVALVVIYALNILSSVPQAVAHGAAVLRGTPVVDTALGPQPMPLSVMLPLYFLGAVVQGVFQPIGVVPWPVLYFDIRTRHEGLDLEWSIHRLREAGVPAAGPD